MILVFITVEVMEIPSKSIGFVYVNRVRFLLMSLFHMSVFLVITTYQIGWTFLTIVVLKHRFGLIFVTNIGLIVLIVLF